jgi:two-component system phosphate regulon response regulator PhoB
MEFIEMLFPNPAATSSFCEGCSIHRSQMSRDPLRFQDIELDWQAHRVTRAGRPVHLSTLDVRILRFLMLSPGRVFGRAEILAEVWPHGIFVSEQTVDVHIGKLRRTLSKHGGSNVIRTVRSRGYALDFDD